MLYLLQHAYFWLILTALAAGFAGWAWRRSRVADYDERLAAERASLRRGLIGLVEPRADAGQFVEQEREGELARARYALLESRTAELEQRLEAARQAREEAAAHAAELERRLARAEETPPAPIPLAAPQPVTDWRKHYLEARVRHLDGVIAELASRPAPAQQTEPQPVPLAAPAAADEAAASRLEWRARYAEARTRYLEEEARAALPDPQDDETARRAHWRSVYLEERSRHLQDLLAEAGEHARQALAAKQAETEAARQEAELARAQALQATQDREAGLARIAALEAAIPDPEQQRRANWRERYLKARVEALESRVAPPSVPQPVASAPPAPERSVPTGQEVRPASLPAPRNGAGDDLTLIEGVSPQQESTLHSLGVYHFDQIAAWSPANVAWVDQYLRLKGRIVRERWVEQAADLSVRPVRGGALQEA